VSTSEPQPAPAPPPASVLPHEVPLPPRVDLWTAAVFFAVAIAILYASWLMPTYRQQAGQLYTAPGLVPSFYGTIIALLSLWLGARSIGRGALKRGIKAPRTKREGYSDARLLLATVLCLVYAIGLIGRLPFWLATAIFVFLFVLLFEWERGQVWTLRARRIAIAAALGLGTGWAVLYVFRDIFLVRLP
jgi:putative tricarboxylic transport membrane protein